MAAAAVDSLTVLRQNTEEARNLLRLAESLHQLLRLGNSAIVAPPAAAAVAAPPTPAAPVASATASPATASPATAAAALETAAAASAASAAAATTTTGSGRASPADAAPPLAFESPPRTPSPRGSRPDDGAPAGGSGATSVAPTLRAAARGAHPRFVTVIDSAAPPATGTPPSTAAAAAPADEDASPLTRATTCCNPSEHDKLKAESRDFKDALEFLVARHMELQAREAYYAQMEGAVEQLQAALAAARAEAKVLRADNLQLRTGSAAFLLRLTAAQVAENEDTVALAAYATALHTENTALRALVAPVDSASATRVPLPPPPAVGAKHRAASAASAFTVVPASP